jgi:hypothetical protein
MMDRLDREQLYNTVWKHWGADAQTDQLIEEMSELIHALITARRNNTFYTYAVSEEMADVSICLEQFEVMMKAFPTFKTMPVGYTGSNNDSGVVQTGCVYDQVVHIREMKLSRLKERLLDSMEKKISGEG